MPQTWEDAIFQIIASCDGHVVTVQDIYAEMEDHRLVTSRLLEKRYGRPYYQHYVRSALARLKKQDTICRVGHGQYIIAP